MINNLRKLTHILQAFERDGFAGLEDQRTRPPTHPANQLSLPFLKEVLDVQRAHPRAGRFRVRGLVAKRTGREPSETTIGRAMAINRRMHGAPEAWATDRPDLSAPDGPIKEKLYEPTHRHRYWFLDYRYLVRLEPVMHFSYKHRTEGGSCDAIMRETDGERVFLGRRTGHGASVWLLSAPGDHRFSRASDRDHLSVASMMTKVHNRL